MKHVYLIRHGLPDFPQGRRMCLGSTDLPLSSEGRAQARAAAAQLPPVTAVFSSPLIRAVQTAEALGAPIILEGLQELFAGDWEGLTFDEIRLRFPELYAARGIHPSLPLPNAEPEDQGLARFTAAMDLAARTSRGNFAVVAHGGIISLFLEPLLGRRYKPDYGQILHLQYKNGSFTLQETDFPG